MQQGNNVEALKLLNNAIVTSRLYPPEAPQAANAVERGYKGLKLFLREHGSLIFSSQDDVPCVGGQPLDQEILDLFPNLVVFRQLRMLGLSQLLLGSDMDRFAFGQILSVFNTPIEKANKSGGGMAYITSLGLASYFSETEEVPHDKVEAPKPAEPRPNKLVKVRPELLACLCGMDRGPEIQEELTKRLAQSDSAVDLLAAGVGYILQSIFKKGKIVASPHFPAMLQGAEAAISAKVLPQVGVSLARILVENLKEPALCVLLCQEFPAGFGEGFYDTLIDLLTEENLRAIIALFREHLAKEKLVSGEESPQWKFFGKALLRLMTTDKGKQFLSKEKARVLIHDGELERKKRRFEAGIDGLLEGNLNILKSEEFLQYLPVALRERFAAGDDKNGEILLKSLNAYLLQEKAKAGGTALLSTAAIGENLLADGRIHLVDIFLEPLMSAVREWPVAEPILEKVANFLHQVMQESWNLGDNRRGDIILTLFYAIRSGKVSRASTLKGIIGKIQDRGIQRAKLPVLLADCLASPLDEALSYRLALQGPVAVRFLVESLINTEDMDDRIKIIDMLTSNSTFLTSAIHERLPQHMPWYGKRNLLKLLGEAGKEEDAECILPYFKHDDLRVQREAFLCLYKIGGRSRKKLFLQALADSSELIKVQIIDALSSFCDNEVAAQLAEMLATNEFFSENNRTDIILQLLETLGRCPSPEALKGVEDFLQMKGKRSTKKIPDRVWDEAEKVLGYLENERLEARKKHLQVGQLRKNALKQAVKSSKAISEQRFSTGLPQEQIIRGLLSQGDTAAAKEMLVQLIGKSARSRNFMQAESLREWLIDIDPTDYSQIIQVAEIIDREKVGAIDKGHLEIWSGLYESLTTEEFAAVYHAQRHKKYLEGEVVVSQGAMQSALFFINSGKVKLFFEDMGQTVLVKTLGQGEIFGAGVFFDASVWTISVASVGISEISSLRRDRLQDWSEEFPYLEVKMRNFCSKFELIDEFIRKSSRDRRAQERFKIFGRVDTTLLDNRGLNLGVSAKVKLYDISIGGLAYQVRISSKDNARLMLGRKVQVKLPAGERPGESISVVGDILAVRSTLAFESEYSVHVRFDAVLDKDRLQEILRAANREALMQ